MIYKICPQELWNQAIEADVFLGAPIDLQDGYIHFSSASQVAETAAKHFAGQNDLLLIAIDEKKFGDDLRWEESRGGDLFPHLYNTFSPAQADFVREMPLGDNGVHSIPI